MNDHPTVIRMIAEGIAKNLSATSDQPKKGKSHEATVFCCLVPQMNRRIVDVNPCVEL